MADKPSASARTAASAETKTAKPSNEALDATAAAVPAGTRDVNLVDSTPSGPVQTAPRAVLPSDTSAAVLNARKTKAQALDEEKVEVVLRVKVPTMGLSVGDKASLPKSYADRLLAAGDALTPDAAAAVSKAAKVKSDLEAKQKEASDAAMAQREKLRASEKEAADAARAAVEESRLSVQAKADAERRKK